MANSFVFDDDQPQQDDGAPAPDSPNPDQPEGSEGNNRNFLLAAIVLGGIVLLSLICMAAYAFFVLPGQRASGKATSEANAAAMTNTAVVDEQTRVAALFTPTAAPTETPIPLPTETLVVVFASPTAIVGPTTDPVTATVEALQTQLAVSQATAATTTKSNAAAGTKVAGTPGTPGTQTLARTGFADEVGLPGMFMAAIVLVAVIMLARRLRQAPQGK
ncbi:MAG TPA: hypothetical protein VGK00_08285 [Anaerolineales bacterium]|jgi:hypothetical protein